MSFVSKNNFRQFRSEVLFFRDTIHSFADTLGTVSFDRFRP